MSTILQRNNYEKNFIDKKRKCLSYRSRKMILNVKLIFLLPDDGILIQFKEFDCQDLIWMQLSQYLSEMLILIEPFQLRKNSHIARYPGYFMGWKISLDIFYLTTSITPYLHFILDIN